MGVLSTGMRALSTSMPECCEPRHTGQAIAAKGSSGHMPTTMLFGQHRLGSPPNQHTLQVILMPRRLRFRTPASFSPLPPGLLSAGLVLQTTPADAQVKTGDYLRNGNFEQGGAGWEAGAAQTKLKIITASGSKVAQLTRAVNTTGDVVISGRPVAVKALTKGQVFTATASVRTTQAGRPSKLVIKQSKAGTADFYTSKDFTAGTTWQRVTVTAKAQSAGSLIEVRLRATNVRAGQQVLIDNVRLQSTLTVALPPPPTPTPTQPTPTQPTPTQPTPTQPTPTQPTPTQPTPTQPTPTQPTLPQPTPTQPTPTQPAANTLTNGCAYSTRGLPSCGAYLGSAYGGNADPTPWETEMGHVLGVHRTYYGAGGVASAVSTATKDLAKHRLPWV